MVYKWRTFETTATTPKFVLRADCKMLKQIPKTSKWPTQNLKQTVATADERGQSRLQFHVRCTRNKHLLSKKNKKPRLKVTSEEQLLE